MKFKKICIIIKKAPLSNHAIYFPNRKCRKKSKKSDTIPGLREKTDSRKAKIVITKYNTIT